MWIHSLVIIYLRKYILFLHLIPFFCKLWPEYTTWLHEYGYQNSHARRMYSFAYYNSLVTVNMRVDNACWKNAQWYDSDQAFRRSMARIVIDLRWSILRSEWRAWKPSRCSITDIGIVKIQDLEHMLVKHIRLYNLRPTVILRQTRFIAEIADMNFEMAYGMICCVELTVRLLLTTNNQLLTAGERLKLCKRPHFKNASTRMHSKKYS